MTHDEILAKVNDKDLYWFHHRKAVLAVVELHKPEKYIKSDWGIYCPICKIDYPCSTIAAIEKELV
jgi:hypothetical protein